MMKVGKFLVGTDHLVRVFQVTVLSFLLLILLDHSLRPAIGLYDEGFVLTNALRLIEGDVPHRDYWSAYPFGASLVAALSFELFGRDLIVARYLHAAWGWLFVLSIYFISKRASSPAVALLVAVLAAWWYSVGLYPSYPVASALALSSLTILLLLRGLQSSSYRSIVFAGLIGGFCVVFRHDFAFYLMGASFLILVSDCVLLYVHKRGDAGLGQPVLLCLRRLLMFMAAFLAISLTLIVSLLFWSGWEPVLDQLIVFPMTGMRENRVLPVPGFMHISAEWKPSWILAHFSVTTLVLGLLLNPSIFKLACPAHRVAIIFFGALALFAIFQMRNRFDLAHAAPSLFFASAFFLLVNWRPVLSGMAVLRYLFSVTLVFGVSAVILGYSHGRTHISLGCALFLDSSCMKGRDDQMDVVRFVKSRTATDDYVFVGNTRHDQIFINDASLYFLLDRRVPVVWSEMHPGVVTTIEVQREMVESLERLSVEFSVLVDIEGSNEPNASSKSSGVNILDEYLASKYRLVYRRGIYSVVQRIGLR